MKLRRVNTPVQMSIVPGALRVSEVKVAFETLLSALIRTSHESTTSGPSGLPGTTFMAL